MADTIETFVAKLKEQGVQSGQRQAEDIRNEASKKAESIIAQANQQAEKIVAEAKTEAENLINRSKTELELAARDATLKLREALEKTVQSLITESVDQQLDNGNFIRDMIEKIVMQYVQSDIAGTGNVKIGVTGDVHRQLADWAIKNLNKIVHDDHKVLDFKATLRQSGFEFNFSGATMEVTKESVVETLMELVGPTLRQALAK